MLPKPILTDRIGFRLLPPVVLVAGLLLTYFLYMDIRQQNRHVMQEKFNFYSHSILSTLSERLSHYTPVLTGAAGLFAKSNEVSREDFHAYIESLQLKKNFPGVQGVGFILQIPAAEKLQHIESMRRSGYPRYSIWPSGVRPMYSSVVYLEPANWRNERAIGFDSLSEPTRFEAMQQARDEDKIIASGKVTLVQESDRDVQPGFLLYMPVYRSDLPHETLQQRRANFIGWVYIAFRSYDLMNGILDEYMDNLGVMVDLLVYDGATPSGDRLLYNSSPSASGFLPSDMDEHTFHEQKIIRLGERDWTLVVNSTPGFETAFGNDRGLMVAGLGTAGSILLSTILWLLVSGRSRTMRYAEEINQNVVKLSERLKAKEDYQKGLLENLPAGVIIHGPEGEVRFCNSNALELLGLSQDQLQGKSARQLSMLFVGEDGVLLPPDEIPVNYVLQHGRPLQDFIAGLKQPNSDVQWVLINAYPEFDENGQLSEIVVAFVSITALRSAQGSLRSAKNELHDLYENAPSGYHSLDVDGLIVRMNQTELDWLGYRREEVVGKMRYSDLLTPDSIKLHRESYPVFIKRGWIRDLEYNLKRKDGSLLPVSLSATAIYDEQGRYIMSRSTVNDITARKEAELRLYNLNQFYTLLSRSNEAMIRARSASQLFDAICQLAVELGSFRMTWVGLMDEDKQEIIPVAHAGIEAGYLDFLARKGVFRFDGPTGSALKSGEFRISNDIEHDPAMELWRHEAVRRGYSASAAFPFMLGDKTVGAFMLYADQPFYFNEDIVSLLQELTHDMSFMMGVFDQQDRRALAEKQLQELNLVLEKRVEERTRLLELANKELESFSYSVSHDLRAPLRSIDGFSDMLQRAYGAGLDERGQDYLGRIRRASKRMGELIDDLLMLARVSRGELRKTKVDLSDMARKLATELQTAAPERAVEWIIAEGLTVSGDARLLKAVLENLLGNAWKFTAKRPVAKIELGMKQEMGEQIYFVRDNGAGFDMKYADKLFGAFQRLHKEEEFEGTGIGLVTVQRIIHRHGGRVWAEGQVGMGATIYFAL